MTKNLILLACVVASIFGMAQSQCKYMVSRFSSSNTRSPIDVCLGNYKYTCDTSGKTLYQASYSTTDCTGTPKRKWNASSNAKSFQCTGQTCAYGRIRYDNAQCTGTPTYVSHGYADASFCGSSQITYCDANNLYTYDYGKTDAACMNNVTSPSASITTRSVSRCLEITLRYNSSYSVKAWRKYSCVSPSSSTPPALSFPHGSHLIEAFKGKTGCLAGNFEYSHKWRLDAACSTSSCSSCRTNFTSSKTYCSGNGGAYWSYVWEGQTCGGNLQAAVYFNTGCGVGGTLGLFSGLSNTTSFKLGCSGPEPPTLQFSSNKFGLIEIYGDSTCQQFLYGGYVLADGVCSPGGSGSLASMASCTPSGGFEIVDYNGATCNATKVNSTQVFGSVCTKIKNSDINGQPIYAKGSKCGQGGNTLNPNDAPNLRTLNGAHRGAFVLSRPVVLGVVALVLGIVGDVW